MEVTDAVAVGRRSWYAMTDSLPKLDVQEGKWIVALEERTQSDEEDVLLVDPDVLDDESFFDVGLFEEESLLEEESLVETESLEEESLEEDVSPEPDDEELSLDRDLAVDPWSFL